MLVGMVLMSRLSSKASAVGIGIQAQMRISSGDPIRVLISRLLRRILMTWFGLRRIRTHISHC